jgi:hypothetical protein
VCASHSLGNTARAEQKPNTSTPKLAGIISRMANVKKELENYVNGTGVNQMFGELLEDVVLARPDEPIDFLLDLLTSKDDRSAASQEKLLRDVWTAANDMQAKKRVKDILRELRGPGGLLQKNFPSHKRQVMCALITNSGDGIVPLNDFLSAAIECLAVPGGPNGRDSSLLSS